MKHLIRLIVRLLRFVLRGLLLPLLRVAFRLLRGGLRLIRSLIYRSYLLLQGGRYAAFGQRRA